MGIRTGKKLGTGQSPRSSNRKTIVSRPPRSVRRENVRVICAENEILVLVIRSCQAGVRSVIQDPVMGHCRRKPLYAEKRSENRTL
jgi:hypothetical protein